MFSRILVPIDGSKPSDKAIMIAVDIAMQNNSYIEILHVSQTPEIVPSSSTDINEVPTRSSIRYKMVQDYYSYSLKKSKEMLQIKLEMVKKISPELEIDAKLLPGNPGEEIIKRSKEGKFDLIVMGSSGLGLRRYLLGSVSTRVVNESKIPVLIIK